MTRRQIDLEDHELVEILSEEVANGPNHNFVQAMKGKADKHPDTPEVFNPLQRRKLERIHDAVFVFGEGPGTLLDRILRFERETRAIYEELRDAGPACDLAAELFQQVSCSGSALDHAIRAAKLGSELQAWRSEMSGHHET